MRPRDEIVSATKRLIKKRDELAKAKGDAGNNRWEYAAWVEALQWALGENHGTVANALFHLPEPGHDELFKGQ